jgi:hypothetical protein
VNTYMDLLKYASWSVFFWIQFFHWWKKGSSLLANAFSLIKLNTILFYSLWCVICMTNVSLLMLLSIFFQFSANFLVKRKWRESACTFVSFLC